jgi:integrase
MGGNVFRRGDRWIARITHNGKQRWRSAPTKTMAQNLLKTMREEADRERMGLPRRAEPLTLAEWSKKYMKWAEENKGSWEDDRAKMEFWVEHLGGLRLPQITRDVVRDELQGLRQKGAAPATTNRYLACLRKALSMAVEAGHLESNVLFRFHQAKEAPARQPNLSPVEEEELISRATPWVSWLIRMALATGARQGELLALKWRDIDLANSVIIIRNSKSGDSRRIPLPGFLLEEITTRKKGKASSDPVIPGLKGTEISSSTAGAAWKRSRKKIDRPDLRFHDLRHVAASKLLAQGATLPEIAAWLGHKTLSMSKRYSHVSWERLGQMVERLNTKPER